MWIVLSSRSRAVADVLLAVTMLLAAAALGLHVAGYGTLSATEVMVPTALAAVALAVPGYLICRGRPGNPVGWLIAVAALGVGCSAAGAQFGVAAYQHGWPGGGIGLYLSSRAGSLSDLIVVVLPLFPDGRPLSPRWRPVVAAVSTCMSLVIAVSLLLPGHVVSPHDSLKAQLPGAARRAWVFAQLSQRAENRLFGVIVPTVLVVILIGTALAVLALVVRYRRSQGRERAQLAAFAAASAVAASIGALDFLAPYRISLWLVPLSVAIFGIGSAIAVLRHRIYDLDPLLRRATVVALLSAILLGAYLAVVAVLAAVLGAGATHSTATAAVAMVVIAGVAVPLHGVLRRAVDRLFHGEAARPYHALTALGRTLEAAVPGSDLLRTVVQTTATTLRLPYVAIEVPGPDRYRVLAEWGQVVPVRETMPLTSVDSAGGAVAVGRLVVGCRRGEERLEPRDAEVLRELARQIALVAHASRLAEDLAASRERIVLGREEERRRLRRDLHDGLGPALAAVNLTAAAIGYRLAGLDQFEDVRELATRLRADAQRAVRDLRRVIDDLRPATLDDLGLATALREQARQLEAASGLAVEVDVADEVLELPAAVETAVLRIASEALTNVAKHAHARHCWLHVTRTASALEIVISDDGIGGVAPVVAKNPGVGFYSMRERAEELGGQCTVQSGPEGGTVVRAVLPLRPGPAPDAAAELASAQA